MGVNKKKLRKKMGLILVLLVLVFTLFSFTFDSQSDSKVSSLVKDVTVSIYGVVTYPFKFIRDGISDYSSLVDIRNKYQDILTQVEELELLKTENMELRKQIDALKNELDVNYTISDYEKINATVICRNVLSWYNTITINKGSSSGITEDMAVISRNGLIGKVESTTLFTSQVKLLTSNDVYNKISVVISDGESNLYGIVDGYNEKTGMVKVSGISNTDSVLVGSYVYTSGLGGIFPGGILIGTVSDISTDEYDLAKIIDVSIAVDMDDVNYVSVLKRGDAS